MEIRLIEESIRSSQPVEEGGGFGIDMERAARANERLARFKAEEAQRKLLEQASALAGLAPEPEISRQDDPQTIVEAPLAPWPRPQGSNALQHEIAAQNKLTDSQTLEPRADWVEKHFSRYTIEVVRVQIEVRCLLEQLHFCRYVFSSCHTLSITDQPRFVRNTCVSG
jgi:hypothetical protein